MIKEKQIKEQAKHIYEHSYESELRQKAFEEGAKWMQTEVNKLALADVSTSDEIEQSINTIHPIQNSHDDPLCWKGW